MVNKLAGIYTVVFIPEPVFHKEVRTKVGSGIAWKAVLSYERRPYVFPISMSVWKKVLLLRSI